MMMTYTQQGGWLFLGLMRYGQFSKLVLVVSATGRSAAWLARLTGGQEVGGSNPLAPIYARRCQILTAAFFL